MGAVPLGLRKPKKELRGLTRPGLEAPCSPLLPLGPRYMLLTTEAALKSVVVLRRLVLMSMLMRLEGLRWSGMEGAVARSSVTPGSRDGVGVYVDMGRCLGLLPAP